MTNTPDRKRHHHAFTESLNEEHSPQYATIIANAGGMKFFLNASDETLDVHNIKQIGHRYRQLCELRGMQAAATALLVAHGRLHEAAEELAELHITTMAAFMEQDATNQFRQS
jgi:hypothetical protein